MVTQMLLYCLLSRKHYPSSGPCRRFQSSLTSGTSLARLLLPPGFFYGVCLVQRRCWRHSKLPLRHCQLDQNALLTPSMPNCLLLRCSNITLVSGLDGFITVFHSYVSQADTADFDSSSANLQSHLTHPFNLTHDEFHPSLRSSSGDDDDNDHG